VSEDINICYTYRSDLYYIDTKINGKSYERRERIVPRWKWEIYKWTMPWRWGGFKAKHVLRER
jgi:hypothetical protein